MQTAFDFGAGGEMAWVRGRLRAAFGRPGPVPLRTPVGQLVKSSISSRTRDEVSLRAYRRLIGAYPRCSAIAAAPTADVQALIAEVTYADAKALHLGQALRRIAGLRPDFDLSFLGGLEVGQALAWLERLPGVGRKVAASTLNFSTLRRPAFVIDSHVLRVLGRLGFVHGAAGGRAAHDRMAGVLDGWTAADLAELHILTKRLGQTACHAGLPDCRNCPLRPCCPLDRGHGIPGPLA